MQMLKEADWSWLGFLKFIPLGLALATGSFSVARDVMFLNGRVTEPSTALLTWLRVCFVISSAIVWFQQHKKIKDLEKRLIPKLLVRNLTSRVWPPVKHGFTG